MGPLHKLSTLGEVFTGIFTVLVNVTAHDCDVVVPQLLVTATRKYVVCVIGAVVSVALFAPKIGVKLILSVELDHSISPALPSKNKNATPPAHIEE